MKTATAAAISYTIFMAGELATARSTCRHYCGVGLCVTIQPVEYVYTGGAENGFIVGLINYPRFPSTQEKLKEHAFALADALARDCCQHSFTIVGPDEAEWRSTREGA